MNRESSLKCKIMHKGFLGAMGSGALSEVINNAIKLKGTSQRKCPVVKQNKRMGLPANRAF